jgi:hypothetical protein
MFRHRAMPPVAFIATALSTLLLVALALQAPHHASSAPTPPPTPPTQPTSVANPQQTPIVGESAITSATGGPITQADIQNYAQGHPIPFNMATGGANDTVTANTIILTAQFTSKQLATLLGTSMGVPDATPLWLVEFQGNFVFPGSAQQPDGLHFTTAFEVYFANTGNLLMEGGLTTPITNPTGGATPTPVGQPTATATPAGVPTATATPAGVAPATPTTAPPTATPIPPTATVAPAVCTLVGSGVARLNVDIGYFDFDTGTQSITDTPASDIHYHAASPAGTFTAINSTAIFDWGGGSPPCQQYLTVGYIPGGTVTVKANETYMERTNGGHIAVFTVTTFSTDIISIAWRTYSVT